MCDVWIWVCVEGCGDRGNVWCQGGGVSARRAGWDGKCDWVVWGWGWGWGWGWLMFVVRLLCEGSCFFLGAIKYYMQWRVHTRYEHMDSLNWPRCLHLELMLVAKDCGMCGERKRKKVCCYVV